MMIKNVTKPLQLLFCASLVFSPMLARGEKNKKPDPKRFAKEIEKFDQQDKISPPPLGAIVFTGSSSIRLWDTKKAFPDLPALNRGFGGSVANDLTVYHEKVVIRYQPKLLVVYTGSNDIHQKMSPEVVLGDYTKFLKLVHRKLPRTTVILNPIKVGRSRIKEMPDVARTNAMLKAWASKRDWIVWVETAEYLKDANGQPIDSYYREDKLHLSDKGYARWNQIIGPVLREEWSKPTYRPWFRPKSLTTKSRF